MSERRNGGSEQSPADFVSRWSRRKHAARSNRLPDADATAGPVNESAGTTPASGREAMPVTQPEPEPIPDLGSLTEQSDYRRFMQSDINADLRRLALRKLFKAPVFGIRDGLDDYDEDFTTFEALGNVVTSDMRFHQQRLEKLAAQESGQPEAASSETITLQTGEAPSDVDASNDAGEPAHDTKADPGASGPEAIAQPAWETVPLKPADPLEPPPPVLAANRYAQTVRAVDDAPSPDPKES